MPAKTSNPAALDARTESEACSLRDSVNSPDCTKPPSGKQVRIAALQRDFDIARLLRREEVHEAAAEAMNYLGAIMNFVAADDVPGLQYSYSKFAAYGRVVALGCKALLALSPGRQP